LNGLVTAQRTHLCVGQSSVRCFSINTRKDRAPSDEDLIRSLILVAGSEYTGGVDRAGGTGWRQVQALNQKHSQYTGDTGQIVFLLGARPAICKPRCRALQQVTSSSRLLRNDRILLNVGFGHELAQRGAEQEQFEILR
jgi:hypothetical protein